MNMAKYKSPVYATKLNYSQSIWETEETLYLGDITFSSLKDGFLEAIRLYKKNVKRHINRPAFIFQGSVYWVDEIEKDSETGRGYTQYWILSKILSKWFKVDTGAGTVYKRGRGLVVDGYVMVIPKSKANLPDAEKYVANYV